MRKLVIGGLLASTMLLPALAQTSSSPPASQPPAARAETPKAGEKAGDMWRSSKLIGLNVYNDQNEKLGDISEIFLDKSGKVDGVVVGVGGFLGVGKHDIKVEWSKLKFVDEPVRSSSSASTSTTGSASNRAATSTTSSTTKDKWYPDHAVLSGATKDSLKSMPEFKYD